MSQALFYPRFRSWLANGTPNVGGKLNTYIAGTSTPLATYQDALLQVSNANPVILDSNGEAQIYCGPQAYKLVLTDQFNNQLWTFDNYSPDVAFPPGNVLTEWITQYDATGNNALLPAFISATQFSLTLANTDLTPIYHVGRRIKTKNTAGIVYSTITASAYAASVTTITVVNDGASVLDSGLAQVNYGVVSYVNPSYLDPRTAIFVTKNGNQAAPQGTTITGWTVVLDQLGEFAANVFTAKYPGTYQVTMQAEVSDTGTQVQTTIQIVKNAVTNYAAHLDYTSPTANNHTSVDATATIKLIAGDNLRMVIQGSANETVYGGVGTYISIIRLA